MRGLRSIFFGVFLAAFAPHVFAQTYCVNSWDGAGGLKAALNQFDAGNSVTIKLVRGTYAFDNGVGHKLGRYSFGKSFVMRGGYAAGCAENQRVIDATNTVIDGQLQPLSEFSIAADGSIAVEGITFTHLAGDSSDPYGALNFSHSYETNASGDTIVIDRCRIIGNKQTFGDSFAVVGAGFSGNTSAATRVSNTLIADNDGRMDIQYFVDGLVMLYNNTYARNGRPAQLTNIAGVFDGDDAIISISNNIFWGNGAVDLDLSPVEDTVAHLDVTYNTIGSLAPSTIGTYAHNSANDPKFVDSANADRSLRDYHLQHTSSVPSASDSPAINVGTIALLAPLDATDVVSNDRLVGSKLDLGAYESPVDDEHNYVVTTTADNGNNADLTANPHSLRWAILNAKHDAHDPTIGGSFNISFAIPCGSSIALNSAAALPAIDFDLTIDGTTNPGWTANSALGGFNSTLCVPIYGGFGLSSAFVTTGNGRLTARGLSIFGFTGPGLLFGGGDGSIVAGNYIALNNTGIYVALASGSVTIGGDTPAERNLIDSNDNIGIELANTTGFNHVLYNLIGLAGDGFTAVGNGKGIVISGSPYNIVDNNTISASTDAGITLQGDGSHANVVQSNLIGVAETGTNDVSNGFPAVQVTAGAANNAIGATITSTLGGNYIRSDNVGAWIDDSAGVSNRVLGNSIVAGGQLALDLDTLGATSNGPTSADKANHDQHYPVIRNAFRVNGYEWIEFDLDSIAGEAFRIDVYASSMAGHIGRAQMEQYLGEQMSSTTDITGHTHFWIRTFAPPGGATAPAQIIGATATATHTTTGSTAGDTSEISAGATEIVGDMIFRDDFDHQN